MDYQLNGISPSYNKNNCFIAPSADLIGNVQLGNNVSVWFQAVIRADNDLVSIGDNSNIQDGSIIHVDKGQPVIIGEGVTIGHKAMLHGCIIDRNCLIGMGAVILNGAKIGKNCIVGAGALVTENKTFPDNSLIIGSPAKAVKTISNEQAELLAQSALHYCAKITEYKKLKPLPPVNRDSS